MKVTLRALDSLKPYENNPRDNDGAIDKVARSLEEFGFRQPIVVDEDLVIIAGHTRFYAAQKLGLPKVPVHVATDLTPGQVRAYRLADNKTHEYSTWDDEKLCVELSLLRDEEIDTDWLEFDVDLGEPEESSEKDPDEVPATPKSAKTKPGDLIELGPHRLICADCCDDAAWGRLMGSDHAQLLLTDPPYGVAYEGKDDEKKTISNDSMSDSQFRKFLSDSLGLAFKRMVPSATFYIWHADAKGLIFRQALEDIGEQLRQNLIWVKDVMTFGRQDYQWQHEPCLYGWKGGSGKHRWFSDRTQTTVLRFNRPRKNREHPTMKPVEMLAYQISNSTLAEDTVLDPFLGSGSTLIAAQRTGRRCCGFEIDPIYCDVIIKRWEDYTDQKAVRHSLPEPE